MQVPVSVSSGQALIKSGCGAGAEGGADVRAVILAAGRGSRIGAETDGCPKCLIELAGSSLLEWQLRSLAAAGINRILVVGGYRSELLCGEYELARNERWAATGVVATLAEAADWLSQGTCVVSYSDIVFHPAHVRQLCASEAHISITYDKAWETLWNERFESPLTDAETFAQSGGWLTAIGARASTVGDIEGQFMGLLRLTPAGAAQLLACWNRVNDAERDRMDMTTLLARLLREGASICTVAVSGRWCEVDRSEDLTLYRRRIVNANADDRRWLHDWRYDWNSP